jgi:hypothetical protein
MALGFDISAWVFVCCVGYTYQARSVFVCRSSGKEVARRIEEDGGEPALFEVNSFQQREPKLGFLKLPETNVLKNRICSRKSAALKV